MSFPPPHSGQYPQYIPPPQYQPGHVPPHVPPQQLPYNHGAPPSAAPYNGYGKQPAYTQSHGMMPYHQYPQYNPHSQPPPFIHQPQQQQQRPTQSHPSPIAQMQQSPHFQMQQQSPQPRFLQQSPNLQYQPQASQANIQQHSPRAYAQQQSPRPLLHQQSPRLHQQHPSPHSQIQQQPPRSSLQQQSPRQQQQSFPPQFQQQSSLPNLQQQSPRFQQQSPLEQLQQQPPRPSLQEKSPRPELQQQLPRPSFQHQSPRLQQQSTRSQHQQQPSGPPAPAQLPQLPPLQQLQQPTVPPVRPPSLPQEEPREEPRHQFVDPSQLFVQPPLPPVPRSRYSLSSNHADSSVVPPSPPAKVPAPPSTSSSAPTQTAPVPLAGLSNTLPPEHSAQIPPKPQGKAHHKILPPKSVKAEPAMLQSSPIVDMKAPVSASKPPSTPSQSRPSPSTAATALPQVMIPGPSPNVPTNLQKQSPKKVQQKRQSSQQSVEKPTKSNKNPVDYQVLLLALADEYLNTAHCHGTKMALATRQADIEEYYKLVATGLGCLEAVLKNWRLQPRKEALVRLRYARTLFEETENDIEAETALSKGIDLCERNRMLDLKYSMQHLLARMIHRNNPKASLKAVDGMILDVETYRHAAWEYAFRFLRVSLSLSSPSHQDSVQALQHLHKIAAMAGRNGDKAVSAMAAVVEALAHLQQGASSDAIEQAQRAVAVARSHQLNDELRHVPQLASLIQMVDICCSLLEYDVNQSGQKLKVMQALIDETLNDPNWRPDGSFSIPLSGKSAGPSSIDTGDILQVQNGTLLLSFSWLPQHDLYALSYFLSSITLSAKNSYDGRKAEKYLDEGLRMVQGDFKAPQEISESMVNATRRFEWRRTLYCNFLLQRVFLAAARTDWDLASQTLKELRQFTQEAGSDLPASIECLIEYAAGTIAQATGDLAAALSIFQSPLLSLSPSASKTSRNDPCRDTCILAALNTVLIIREPGHPSHSHLPNILALLESFCQNSPNKYIQAAYYLVCATVQTESTIQTKQYLQQALQSATAISNSQITCMTLTFMSWKYFRGVVGEQAEKSARAGRAMAKRANDRLWASVTDEMLADTLERQGKTDEARGVREEGGRLNMGLPPGLRRPI